MGKIASMPSACHPTSISPGLRSPCNRTSARTQVHGGVSPVNTILIPSRTALCAPSHPTSHWLWIFSSLPS